MPPWTFNSTAFADTPFTFTSTAVGGNYLNACICVYLTDALSCQLRLLPQLLQLLHTTSTTFTAFTCDFYSFDRFHQFYNHCSYALHFVRSLPLVLQSYFINFVRLCFDYFDMILYLHH